MKRDEPLRVALREADWEVLLPRLVAYASACLRRAGWASGRDFEPSKMSVEHVVNQAIEHCLDGSRTWDPSNVDFPGFLRGVIRSLVSAERKQYVKRRTFAASDDRIAEAMDLADSPEDDAVTEEARIGLLADVAACARGDADLEALCAAILDGHVKREELVEALGWTPERVSVARKKLQRRLVRRGVSHEEVEA